MFVFIFALTLIVMNGKVEAQENWDDIYKAAKSEGKVVIYSLSSRVFKAVKAFKEKYPGIEVEASDMRGNDQIEKLTREQAAGIYNVDVCFWPTAPHWPTSFYPKD